MKRSNRIILSLLLASGLSAHGAFELFDDFEGVGTAFDSGINNGAVLDDSGNKVFQLKGAATTADAKSSGLISNPIAEGTTGTFFYQIYLGGFTGGTDEINCSVGLSAVELAGTTAAWGNFAGYNIYAEDGVNLGMQVRNGAAGAEIVGTATPDSWYNVWLVFDNAAETYDCYMEGPGLTGQQLMADDFAFRKTGAGALDYVALQGHMPTQHSSEEVYVDNIYIDNTGENLDNPAVPVSKVYYVASAPTDWTDAAAWSDGNAATTGTAYYVTNNVALQTPTTATSFPGKSLTLSPAQRLEVMTTGTDVITIEGLTLNAAELAAGGTGTGEAKIDGVISVSSNCTFSGAANDSRDLRILSKVIGSTTAQLELTAPTQTIFIDQATNSFSGTWIVSDGTAVFSAAPSIGSASIDVQGGTLRILGDWDGLAEEDSLTVADGASVDLGTYAWTVDSLMIGSSNVLAGSTYDAAALNALGAATFTGTGTIQVGNPYIPPQKPDEERLVAHWPMDEGFGTLTTDESGNGYDGAIVGATWATGTENRASYLEFGGSPAHVNPSLTLPPMTEANEFTWAVWVKKDAAAGGNSIILGNRKDGTNAEFSPRQFIKMTPTKFEYHVTSSSNTDYTDPTADTWVHLAVVKSGTEFQSYVNGVADAAGTTGGKLFTEAMPFFIGGELNNSAGSEFFTGGIDDVRLYDYALNASEIVYVMNDDGFTGPVEPPVMAASMVGGDMVVSWTSPADFKLQTLSSLPFDEWEDVPGATNSPVTVPATNDVECLRLIER